jgi:heptosyltransferase II
MTSRLVIAPNWIGDTVMAIPFLRALKRAHPEDHLAVLGRSGPAAIFRAEGSVDAVLTRSSFLADTAVIRRGRFGEAWLLPNSFRAALLAFLGGVPARIGYATDRRGFLLTGPLPAPPRTAHQLRDYDSLLLAHGIAPDLEAPRLTIPEAAARRAADVLAAAGLDGSERLALLAPGAAFSWTKRWPPDRFGRLGAMLRQRDWACALVIGPGEEELAREASQAAPTPLPILGANLDPIELAALLARARVVVANDSGPMHLAAAVGTPVAAFFGPTDPGRTAPTGAPSRILDRYVFCSPCFLKECPYGHECMREITVEQALRAIERPQSPTPLKRPPTGQ